MNIESKIFELRTAVLYKYCINKNYNIPYNLIAELVQKNEDFKVLRIAIENEQGLIGIYFRKMVNFFKRNKK